MLLTKSELAFQLQVPGRVCFFGDHQDYLGLPVIAGAIDRYITLTAQPNGLDCFNITLTNTNTAKRIPLSLQAFTAQPDYFFSGLAVMLDQGVRIEQGYDLTIEGNIPMNAGLSSSTALVTAWIKFLAAVGFPHLTTTNDQIATWSHRAEVAFFNQPGGHMDHITIAHQGLICLDNTTLALETLNSPFESIVIAESGIEKKTLEVLRNARTYAEKAIQSVKTANPEFKLHQADGSAVERYMNVIDPLHRKHWYAAIHNHLITREALQLFKQQGTAESLGRLMNAHQHILENCIENTPKAMSQMMDLARQSGAYGAKIVGSGGGGVMVALCSKDNCNKVMQAFKEAGAVSAYEVQLLQAREI